MASSITGTWKYFSPFFAFRDGQLIHNGYSSMPCRPWVSTDGTVRETIYTDTLNNRYYDYYYGWQFPTHSLKYTQVYSGLIIVPTADLLSNYNINNYAITPVLSNYTNTHKYSFDSTVKSSNDEISVFMNNDTNDSITVNCFSAKKNVAVSRGEEGRTTYADALIMAFYLDTPIIIPAHSTVTHIITIRTEAST